MTTFSISDVGGEAEKNATNGIAMMKSRFELRGNIIMTSESLIEMSENCIVSCEKKN